MNQNRFYFLNKEEIPPLKTISVYKTGYEAPAMGKYKNQNSKTPFGHRVLF